MIASLLGPRRTLATAHDVVATSGPMRVVRYRSDARVHATPVVLIPSIINRAYVLDLRPGQSLAEHLLGLGLDVFLIDWGTPRAVDQGLGFADYGRRLIEVALRAVRRESGAKQAHLLGYCLGGTFALTAAASGVAGIASVVAMTTPVDLAERGPLGVLTDARLLDLERLARAWPVVPGPALWAAFQALDPVGIGRKWRGFRRRRKDAEFRARFEAQETWLADPVPVTRTALLDVVEGLYRQNRLAGGTLSFRGRPVRLAQGRAPVLNLIAESDTLVPASASLALERLWGGPVTTHLFPGGHIGVTVGSRAPKHLWTVAGSWLTASERSA